jgi:hypothetical protein
MAEQAELEQVEPDDGDGFHFAETDPSHRFGRVSQLSEFSSLRPRPYDGHVGVGQECMRRSPAAMRCDQWLSWCPRAR